MPDRLKSNCINSAISKNFQVVFIPTYPKKKKKKKIKKKGLKHFSVNCKHERMPLYSFLKCNEKILS